MALLPPVPYRRVSYEDLRAKVSFSLRRRLFSRAGCSILLPSASSMNRPLLVVFMRRRHRAMAED